MPRLNHLLTVILLLTVACSGGKKSGDEDVYPGYDVPYVPPTDSSSDITSNPDTVVEPPKFLLQSATKRLLSRRGAHSYLWYPKNEDALTDKGGVRGPSLFWRQHSDLVSHLGAYSSLIDPFTSFVAPDACVVDKYGWNASHAVRQYACGDLKIIETAAYVDASTIAMRFRVMNDGAPTAFSIRGTPSTAGMSASINQDTELQGFRASITEELVNLWSDPIAVTWQIAAASKPTATSAAPSEDGSYWSFNYAIESGETLDIVHTYSIGESMSIPVNALDPDGLYGLVSAVDTELHDWFDYAPQQELLSNITYRNAWYLFWENTMAAFGNWPVEAITPSKRQYFRGVWLWDSAFHAISLAQGGQSAVDMARKQVQLFVSNAMPDGHIPREIWTHDINPGTQPPGLLTWASFAVSDAAVALAAEDEEVPNYLATDYAVLKSNHQWFKDNLDSDGDGLCEWEGTDSGWDNSPRFDAGPVEALDLACWLYLDAVLLSTMAQRLAQIDDHFAFHDEAAAILQRIQTDFWDAGQGFFFDLEVDTNIRRPVRSPATFLPLFVGAATPEQAAAVALHLNDTNTFSTLFPLPSVAPTDPAYSATNYWRGPVWIILNALTIWGLERYDFDKEADALRTKTLELIESQETTYEYYNSQNGEPLGGQDFMWTAALYILLQGDDPTIW